VLYLFIYSKVTTCFGPYSGPSSGHKMNSLRKLYSVIYKIMHKDLYTLFYKLHCTVSSKNSCCDLMMARNKGRNMTSP